MLKRIQKMSGAISTKTLVLIFLSVALLIFSSAIIELDQSKEEMYELMTEQSHSLLESMLASSRNALLSSEKIELEVRSRLLNNANLVKLLFEKRQVNNSLLRQIAEENNIYRINIFNKSGSKIFSSHEEIHEGLAERRNPIETIKPILTGEKDTLIIGVRGARFEPGNRFIVAIASSNDDAIVLNVDAEQLLQFRKEIGFGKILKETAENPEIIYIALQDFEGIIAGAGKVNLLVPIDDSPEFENALSDSTYGWRIADFDSLQAFEAFHPFVYKGELIGLFRLGLSLEPIKNINNRIFRRVIIIGFILFLLGSIIILLIVSRQNLNILSLRYKAVESYSNEIVQNVSDAIIALDNRNVVTAFNKQAETLLQLSADKIISTSICKAPLPVGILNSIDSKANSEMLEVAFKEIKLTLLLSKSRFRDETGNLNTIILIRDLTKLKKLESQIQRKDRLSAMGELASGVAHEIRNPLNTIGTIVQQLEKDFKPLEYQEDYYSLAAIVRKEVKRINETIESFLRFSKPEPIIPSKFNLGDLIATIQEQYQSMLKEKSITLDIELKWNGVVYWDKNQIKQVLMNLIQNAFDAFEKGGKIKLLISEKGENVEIVVADDGPGIPEHLVPKIFNLYFTTKAKGTGIGLSIVQRIIDEHGGIITVESSLDEGTTFVLQIPVDYLNKSN